MSHDPLPELDPYLRAALDAAAEEALRLHADGVGLEHLVHALVTDEDSAAHRAVVHAFADPGTIAFDVRAISPGILVVASDAVLPFSPRALDAARAARREACERGLERVGPPELARAAAAALPDEARARLEEAGWSGPPAAEGSGGPALAVPEHEHLFHRFGESARRALSAANRAASRADEPSIGPARLLVAALAADDALAHAGGLSARRAEGLLAGHTLDASAPARRELERDEELLAFLARLPAGAGSIDVLLELHAEPESELCSVFTRQKVHAELLKRAADAFEDPAPGA